MRKRYYVAAGLRGRTSVRRAFSSDRKVGPGERLSFPFTLAWILGPYRTRRAALLVARFEPFTDTVEQAERKARQYAGGPKAWKVDPSGPWECERSPECY